MFGGNGYGSFGRGDLRVKPPKPRTSRVSLRNDEMDIRWAVENWVVWRDSGDWDRFAELWHPQGRMVATWFQASAPDFIARSKRAFADGMKGAHMLGGCSVELRGDRAIAQTKMQINQRGLCHDVEVDVACLGRFFDFFERVNGRWVIYLRQPIYELDRMTPVSLDAELKLDPEILASFPEGYRHLAYLQSLMGFQVSRDLPGVRGPAMDALREKGERWLAGEAIEA